MKCSFCKNVIPEGKGRMHVRGDGTIFYFCSSKCQKNWKLKRDPKKVNWVRKKQPGEAKEAAKSSKK